MRVLGTMLTPFGLVLVLAGTILFVRAVLIVIGRLKSPLLRTFEPYNDAPPLYNSLRNLALWITLILTGILLCLADVMRLTLAVVVPVLLTGIIALLAHEHGAFIRRHFPFLMPLPGWYHELLARTTSLERRHIAYRWLALPARMRSHYSYDDDAFRLWVDLVIASSIY